MLCGASLFLLSQSHCFASAAIFSEVRDFSAQDVIGNEEEESKDEKLKSARAGCAISQCIHSDNKEQNVHSNVSGFLKQIDRLHFYLRSPPIFCS